MSNSGRFGRLGRGPLSPPRHFTSFTRLPAAAFRHLPAAAFRHRRGTAAAGLALTAILSSADARADLTNPALYTLDPQSPFNALEIASARANQATYNVLNAKCGAQIYTAGGPCTPAEVAVLNVVTELVDTANALLGSGPTGRSLGLDVTGLRLALRWTAATEVAAIGSINTRFAANQLAGLATRLSALRWGAGGIAQASKMKGAPDEALGALVAATDRSAGKDARGGGAGADTAQIGSRFSAYLDEAYDFGDKAPTVYEDAFAFDGKEFTLGGDYRLSSRYVAGGVFGYSTKRVDFNSDLSTVDGAIRASGYSGLLYAMFEGDSFYVSLAGGFQRLTYDIRRRINYPSFNPAVSGVDSTALSNTASNSIVGSLNVGYTHHWGGFAVEPYAIAAYKNIRVNSFQELSHSTANPGVQTAYGVRIAPQSIHSFELNAGLKLQYVWTPRFAVIVPYANGVWHHQLSDKSRLYTATYSGAVGIGPSASFLLATDPAPAQYFTVSGGFSAVLPHGIQGFVQYTKLLRYTHYTDSVVSGGIRLEF